METQEQKRRRLYGKQHLPAYLRELNRLVKSDVTAEDLLSIVETDKICEVKISSDLNNLKKSFKILFNEKEKLENIILNNVEKINLGRYLFTSYSMDCGVLKISSLDEFNFNFSFRDERTGLISLVREDLLEKIILDFSEEFGTEYLEIEIYKIKLEMNR